MKRILTNLLMAAVMAGTFGVANLAADEVHQAVADIPFDFVVAHKIMPAGKYVVSKVSAHTSVFALRSNHEGIFFQMGVLNHGNPEHPSLTFACQGKTHLLVKVTPPGSDNSYSLSKDAIQRQLDYHLGVTSLISVKINHP